MVRVTNSCCQRFQVWHAPHLRIMVTKLSINLVYDLSVLITDLQLSCEPVKFFERSGAKHKESKGNTKIMFLVLWLTKLFWTLPLDSLMRFLILLSGILNSSFSGTQFAKNSQCHQETLKWPKSLAFSWILITCGRTTLVSHIKNCMQ